MPTRNEGSPNGEFFRVNEADFPLRRGWFYHEGERGTTKSGAYLAKLYAGTVGKAILRGKSIGNKRIRLLKEQVPVKGCEVRVLRSFGTPKVSYTLYCADQAVIDAILNAKGDDGETDYGHPLTV